MFYKLSKKKLANALRFLSIDAINLANSGHPGMPLGMADIAEVLWNDFLVHNPHDPTWVNRDRFILSNGHGSILQYALLHLAGYPISIEDLKHFRQINSNTPGHPEYNPAIGIEATTGPLGQGLGMAIGMALAEKLLASKFNKEELNIIDHYTYCFVGDGCLMEGVSHEVCSLAGTLGLNKLIVFWDNNQVSIDGNTENWFTENVAQRFKAYNWQVIENIDGHDPNSITEAIVMAKSEHYRPTLLCCNTIIGYGSSYSGTAMAHGTSFNREEVAIIRKNLAWEYEAFHIPADIYTAWRAAGLKSLQQNILWKAKWQQYQQQYPELFAELNRRLTNILPENLDDIMNQLIDKHHHELEPIATRQASKICLDAISAQLPELFGGSADLSNSNLTMHINAIPFDLNNLDKFKKCNYLNFGVREFGMFCILNGMSLHQGFIPYGGTFLAFIDYAKSAVRLSGLMQNKIIYVLTHDSIGVGEDGPTHQPIEQLSMLRMIPNISVWRPCDLVETIFAWRCAIYNNHPTCLILSRQIVAPQTRDLAILMNIQYGGYILYDVSEPAVILIATGSEVNLAMLAAKKLLTIVNIRVVAMPSMDVFLRQSQEYQEQVLPSSIIKRVAIEAGNTLIWHKFVGLSGKIIGIDNFGVSATIDDIYRKFNITVEHIIDVVLSILPEK